MKPNLAKTLLYACLLTSQLLSYSTVSAKTGGGAIAGGGGDASETRVDEIRADILKWINNGGAKGLILPEALTYSDYESKMKEILKSQNVVVAFVEQDDKDDKELQVSVDGSPKTCRGFLSDKDSKFHILCNISRFANTTDADQYQLIHHEYAGLVNVENNDEAASDYFISKQLTNYLSMQTVLKLAVKSEQGTSYTPVAFSIKKRKYIGNNRYEYEMVLSDSKNIFQLILNNSDDPKLKRAVLDNSNNYTFKTIIEADKNDDEYALNFIGNTVQYTDGKVSSVPNMNYVIPSRLTIQDILNKENKVIKDVIRYKIISDKKAPKTKFAYVTRKAFKTTYEVSFDSSKVDFSSIRGIMLYKNGKVLEELMSDDPADLEQFIKNKIIKGETTFNQRVRYTGLGCGEVNYYDKTTNESYNCKPLYLTTSKYYEADVGMDFAIKFISKGNKTTLKFSTLRIPSPHPDKEANDYEKEYDDYYIYRDRNSVYELDKME